jgi:hypothetical protein
VRTRLQTHSGLSTAWVVSRLIAALSLLLGPDTMVQMVVAWTVIALATVAVQSTHRLGGEDGSDQMDVFNEFGKPGSGGFQQRSVFTTIACVEVGSGVANGVLDRRSRERRCT